MAIRGFGEMLAIKLPAERQQDLAHSTLTRILSKLCKQARVRQHPSVHRMIRESLSSFSCHPLSAIKSETPSTAIKSPT